MYFPIVWDAASHGHQGNYYTSVFVPLLPYLEQQPLFQQFYQVKISGGSPPLGGPGSLAATPLSVLACPSDSGIPSPPSVQWPGTSNYYGVTSYRANAGGLPISDLNFDLDGVIDLREFNRDGSVYAIPVRIVDVTDGTSNTVLLGEVSNYDPNWPQYFLLFFSPSFNSPPTYPLCLVNSVWTTFTDWPFFPPQAGRGYYPLNSNLPPLDSSSSLSLVLSYTYIRVGTYGSGHAGGGANFAFCDGSVHFLSNAINNTPGLLSALCTRAGGEVVQVP